MFNLLMTGLTAYNAVKANQNASESVKAQQALTDAEVARNEQMMALYAEGSAEMKRVMDELYGGFGTYDEVSVENFGAMRDFFSTNRRLEDAQNRSEISDEEARDLAMLFSQEADNRAMVGRQDYRFNMNAPSTYDMAPNVDRIAQKFINARMANAERAIDTQYAKGLADVPAGMENSTLRVQLERSAADMRSQALNDAMLAGVNDAISYSEGVQGLTKGEQNLNLTNREFGQSLLDQETEMGRYGMDVFRNYNGVRTQAISDLSGIQGLRTDAALQDYLTGLNTMNAQSGIFNDYVRGQMDLVAAPVSFAADGTKAGSFGTALDSMNSLTATAISNSKSSFGAFGTYLDRYMGYDDTPIS